jgi:hypothetical protein
LEELEIGDEYTVAVTADEEAVCVWHVDYGSTFGAVFVAGVKPDVVLDVEFPHSFMVLQGETEDVTEGEAVLVVCIDVKAMVEESCRRVLEDGVWDGVVETGPVGQCMSPDVGAEEILPVDGCGNVAQDGLNVTLDCVLPLLVWGRGFMSALVVLVKCEALLRSEGGEVVAS